jgi:hypothetical protein
MCRWFAETVNLGQLVFDSGGFNDRTYALQIIQGVELWTQTTVYTQELLVHDRSQRQCAERVHACFIYCLRVLVLALELECEVISQMSAFVVSTEQPERVWVPDLQGPQIQDTLWLVNICAMLACDYSYLDTEVTTIHIIAQKEVARLGRVATDLKKLHEIVVLAVDVAAHGDGCVHLQQIGLCLQDLCAFPYDP